MAGLYDKFNPTAVSLLTKFGRPAELSRTVEGVYDPATGGSTDTVVVLTGVGVIVPIKAREANGTTIQVGDQKLIFSGDDLAVGDTLDGLRIASLEPVNPDASGRIIQKAILRG